MPVSIRGTAGGSVTLSSGAAAADTTLTLPNTTGTVALTASPTFSGTTTVTTLTATTITSPSATALTLQYGGTTGATLDTSGNLLVGTTATAVAKLQVYTSGTTAVQVQSGTNCYGTGNISGTGAYNGIVFSNNGYSSFVASVQVLASSVVYNTSSDARLKLNVQDAAPVLDLVNSVQVRSFDWKNTGEHQRYGMVAQELQVVAPEFVNDQLDDDHTLGIDYSKLVPMLTKAIQELSAKNDALEARLAALEAK